MSVAGRCPVDVPMAAGVVTDPPIPDGSEGLNVPMFVGVVHGEARRVVFDGDVASVQPSPNSDSAAWVRVATPGHHHHLSGQPESAGCQRNPASGRS